MTAPLVSTYIDRLDDDRIAACGWMELFSAQQDARFYQHPDWFLAADESLLSSPVEIACVHQAGKLKLLLPWQARIQRHRFHAPVHDHLTLGDVLIHPELSRPDRTAATQNALSLAGDSLWDWQIGNVPERSELLRIFNEQATDAPKNIDAERHCNESANDSADVRGHWGRRKTHKSAWFDLQAGLPPCGGKLRRNLKRLRVKLQETGQVRMQWVSRPNELPEAFSHFLTLEASGWKGEQGKSTAIGADPRLTNFYRRLLQPRFDGLQPLITLLWLDDHCIAAQFGLRTGNCLSLLKIAYCEEHSCYSPGSLLLQDTAKHAVEQGLSTLSLVTAPPWAERWHPHTEPVWHITHYANNSGGRALRTLDRFKQTARSRMGH